MWNQILFEAISEYNYKNPGTLNKVVNLNPTEEWSDEEWKLYNEAAQVLVEPNAYIGRYDADDKEMEYYYNQCDRNGFGFVKGQIDQVENSERWKKVCDLVERMGY
jgi:hypothetical protein